MGLGLCRRKALVTISELGEQAGTLKQMGFNIDPSGRGVLVVFRQLV